ncbi:MAG: addiction module protein [Gallionellaceae bacterium]
MLNMEKFSRAEKLRMLEAIWDDLVHDTEMMPSPEWHADELKKAERAYEEKQADLVSWEVAKKILRDGTV